MTLLHSVKYEVIKNPITLFEIHFPGKLMCISMLRSNGFDHNYPRLLLNLKPHYFQKYFNINLCL